MIWLALWLHVLALAVWLGETIFFSAVVAPVLFGRLPVEEAGRIVAWLFPIYYAVGYGCGAVLVATALLLWRRSPAGGGLWLVVAGVAALALAACAFAGLVVLPEVAALRAQLQDPAAPVAVRAAFDAGHRLSVQLNAAVLVATLVLAGLLAARLATTARNGRRLSHAGADLLR
jgi:hypothetical protein